MDNNSPITFEDLINRLSSNNKIENDFELNHSLLQEDIESLGKHIIDYDNILRNYSNHVDKTLQHKRIMKIWFFVMSLLIVFACTAITIICIICLIHNIGDTDFNIIDYIVPTITSITSFLTVFIIIPKIIAKYLFNSKEDESMKEIIASIQEYDKYIRGIYTNNKTEQ